MRLIDADALIDGYKHMGYDPSEHPEESYMEGWCKGFNSAVEHCIHHVIHAPTIEPERETGEWIEHHEPYTWMGYTFWSCSNCGFECGYDKEIRIKTNFCPNCGARMEGGEQE